MFKQYLNSYRYYFSYWVTLPSFILSRSQRCDNLAENLQTQQRAATAAAANHFITAAAQIDLPRPAGSIVAVHNNKQSESAAVCFAARTYQSEFITAAAVADAADADLWFHYAHSAVTVNDNDRRGDWSAAGDGEDYREAEERSHHGGQQSVRPAKVVFHGHVAILQDAQTRGQLVRMRGRFCTSLKKSIYGTSTTWIAILEGGILVWYCYCSILNIPEGICIQNTV